MRELLFSFVWNMILQFWNKYKFAELEGLQWLREILNKRKFSLLKSLNLTCFFYDVVYSPFLTQLYRENMCFMSSLLESITILLFLRPWISCEVVKCFEFLMHACKLLNLTKYLSFTYFVKHWQVANQSKTSRFGSNQHATKKKDIIPA